MKKIAPYKNLDNALQSLDNGGQFFNFRTKAEDGIITQSELGKVAGLFAHNQQMILFLDMSLKGLDRAARNTVIDKLDSGLQETYTKYKAQELLPSEAKLKGIISSNAIITGIPQMVEAKTEFKGFIMIPIMSENVTTFMMIPLIDKYDVYELRDEASSETFLIAHLKGANKLPQKKITLGGVLKELNESKEKDKTSGKFLEVIYHIDY